MIIPPVINPDRYRTDRGDAMTLVNLNANKGAKTFFDLARQFQYRPFIGVEGSYGRQMKPSQRLMNLTIIRHTPNIREVYGQTRILLMPSQTETWGRVALEAACSGIPTIAHPSPGVVEALGDAGLYADRSQTRQWSELISRLDDPVEYERASALSLARSQQMSPEVLISRLEDEILTLGRS
jgi:glycosyltransferase involved in cell wall biosynthesis